MDPEHYIYPRAEPMLGSTLTSAPRLEGDGMDSEAITMVTRPVEKPPLRHANLMSSNRTTSFDKKSGPKYIPREPVKGAVKAVDAAPLVAGKTSLRGPLVVVADSQKMPYSNSKTSALVQTENGKRSSHLLKKSQSERNMSSAQDLRQGAKVETLGIVNVPSYKSMVKVQSQAPHSQKQLHASRSDQSFMQSVIGAEPRSKFSDQQDTMKSKSAEDVQKVRVYLPPPEEEREVEGQARSSQDKLVQEVEQLKGELEMMSKVNADLKKLLVASVGDDLHHRVETLVRTKAQLASEIGGYTKQIYEDYENLEELAIQADMWRSKYTASRVLVDKLDGQKEALNSVCDDSKRALQQLMQERQQLKENLVQTHRYLKLLRDSFEPSRASKPPPTVPNILELARTNLLLADGVKFQLLRGAPMLSAALDAGIQDGLTPAEKLAYKVLSNDEDFDSMATGAAPGRLPARSLGKYSRFHPQVRYENVTFNCCRKCKGEIHVV